MTRLLNTMTKDEILDLIASQEDVPLIDGRMLTTTDAGEYYLASKVELAHIATLTDDGNTLWPLIVLFHDDETSLSNEYTRGQIELFCDVFGISTDYKESLVGKLNHDIRAKRRELTK